MTPLLSTLTFTTTTTDWPLVDHSMQGQELLLETMLSGTTKRKAWSLRDFNKEYSTILLFVTARWQLGCGMGTRRILEIISSMEMPKTTLSKSEAPGDGRTTTI